MNDAAHKQMVQEAVKAKFRGHQVLLCKRQPQYPVQAEREFQRVTNAYMDPLNRLLKKYLPKIVRAAEAEESSRSDDTGDLISKATAIFNKMAEELQRSTSDFGLYDKIQAMAALTRKLSIKEWKLAVKETLGVDLFDDYYSGELFRELMERWISENVGLIKTIPQDSLESMRNIVLEGVRSGRTIPNIVKAVQNAYNVDKRHARLIARDQIAKLNSDIAEQQQTDAGVKEYIWSTSGDQRVRPSHKKLDGKRFRWDDPPIVDERTGRRCHPGRDYQCRCVALPVFDWDTIDLPVAEKGGMEA